MGRYSRTRHAYWDLFLTGNCPGSLTRSTGSKRPLKPSTLVTQYWRANLHGCDHSFSDIWIPSIVVYLGNFKLMQRLQKWFCIFHCLIFVIRGLAAKSGSRHWTTGYLHMSGIGHIKVLNDFRIVKCIGIPIWFCKGFYHRHFGKRGPRVTLTDLLCNYVLIFKMSFKL